MGTPAAWLLLVPLAAGGVQATAPADRYRPRDPQTLVVPLRPWSKKDYVDFLREQARQFESGPDRGPYTPRHALPALAVMAFHSDARLAEGIKKSIRRFSDQVDQDLARNKFIGLDQMNGGFLFPLYFRELRRRGFMTPEDEKFAKDLILKILKHTWAWRPGDGLWRGHHHRALRMAANHMLAAALYPGEPDAPKWKAYAEAAWVELRGGSVGRAAVFQGTRLQHGGKTVFSSGSRRDFEREGS